MARTFVRLLNVSVGMLYVAVFFSPVPVYCCWGFIFVVHYLFVCFCLVFVEGLVFVAALHVHYLSVLSQMHEMFVSITWPLMFAFTYSKCYEDILIVFKIFKRNSHQQYMIVLVACVVCILRSLR